MKTTVSLLIPFDLGLELDFTGAEAKSLRKEISTQSTAEVSFQGQAFPEAKVATEFYKFGVGLMQLSFQAEGDLGFWAQLSCQAEKLQVGGDTLVLWAGRLVEGIIERAKKYANYQYERRLEEIDIFPVFVLEKGPVGEADSFLRSNRKALYGIVAGEPHYDALSDFVLDQERLVNFGYYENELVLIKRFGAVVSSAESATILNMIRLAYSVHWNLRSHNFLLDQEIDDTQDLLSHLPPYYKFWLMPKRYETFSQEAMSFSRDKLAIVESLFKVSTRVPRVDYDWHLRTIYKYVEREFDIDDLSKAVETKLGRIEESYNSARDFLSNNFFIAVEILLILSLAWMVLDTSLLFVIANK